MGQPEEYNENIERRLDAMNARIGMVETDSTIMKVTIMSIKETVGEIKDEFKEVIGKFTQSLDNLNCSIQNIDKTMVLFESKLERNSDDISSVKSDVKVISGKLETVEDSGKVNINKLFADRAFRWVLGGGVLAFLYTMWQVLVYIATNWDKIQAAMKALG